MSPDSLRRTASELRRAAAFLTRFPVGVDADSDDAGRSAEAGSLAEAGGLAEAGSLAKAGNLAGAVWAFPVVGAVLGAFAAAVLLLLDGLGLPAMLSALAAVGTLWLATGGLHEDGLADLADGIGGGASREARLAIMRDSRIGSHGAMALVVSALGRSLALAALLAAGGAESAAAALVAATALSRAAMVPVMASLGHARGDGLAVHAGRPTATAAALATGLGALIAVLWLGVDAGLLALAAALAAALVVARLAQRRLGGQTGDVLGATAQLAELAALAVLTMAD